MPAFTQYSTGLKLVTQVQEVRRSSIKISIQKNWNAGPSPKLFNFIYNTLATFNYLLLVSIPGQYTCLCGSSQNYYSSSGNERSTLLELENPYWVLEWPCIFITRINIATCCLIEYLCRWNENIRSVLEVLSKVWAVERMSHIFVV